VIEIIQNPEDRQLQEMIQRYRNVFRTGEGRRVLGHILELCHFSVPLNSEEERHEYNVGIAIARMCGIMSDIDSSILGIKED
jgi:hypothetical protein